MVAYRLDMLDPRLFEHVVQALALGEISATVIPFGDGPDGGREATFTGPTSYGTPTWDGHGVIQAKYKIRPQDPAPDARWLCTELKKELKKYTRKDNPLPVPDYLILATNVNLSASRGGGKESVIAILRDFASKYGIKDFDLWDYDKIGRILDRNPEVRKTYMAWILPSDVLYELFTLLGTRKRDRYQIMLTYLQRELLADQFAMLEQAGHSSDIPISLAQVFVDLPTSGGSRNERIHLNSHSSAYEPSQALEYGHGYDAQAEPRFVNRVVAESGLPAREFNVDERDGRPNWESPRNGRYVLIGGPGQGKTTVGQYICQLFRCALLTEVKASKLDSRVPPVIEDITKQWAEDGHTLPIARRIPFRIVLNQFAKSLASGETKSILDYLALQLCRGSAKALSPEEMDAILTEYPSIIILDGLDEVPAVTNRDDVMEAVSNFSIEVATGELDVFLIATTRPQGYNDEFSPKQYAHHHLKPLNISDALDYGQKLARNRFGASEERYAKVYERLQRAAQRPTTAKLMESPLQVTILTLLVDRMGDPPDERWDLFNKYYDLIFARETERDIPTVKVLKDHPSIVHAIHRRVGIALQVQSEKSGRTNARLTERQFKQLVADYLSEEGYTGKRGESLAQQVIDAAAFRLVFLVGLETDQVGFEIRSLQEFMAAEAIIDAPELQIQNRLQAIAPLDHWRNVFLFAAGKIFAERQHLRDTIRVICADLNEADNDRTTALLMTGSQLALDLLEDGPARKSPTHYKALTRLAVKLLELDSRDHPLDAGGRPGHPGRIAALCDEDTHHIFADYLRSRLLNAGKAGESLWSFLVILTDSFGDEFEQIARQANELDLLSEPSVFRTVTRITDGSNEWLRNYLTRAIEAKGITFGLPVSPTYLKRGPYLVTTPWNRGEFPSWMNWYADYCGGVYHNDFGKPMHVSMDGVDCDFSIVTLADGTRSQLAPPADLPSNPNWDLVHAAARFCITPSKETLGNTLDALPDEVSDWRSVDMIARQYPWPLAEALLAKCSDPDTDIAGAVRRGFYGDFPDWQATEKMLEDTSDFRQLVDENILIPTRDGGISRFPYRAILSSYSFRLRCTSFTAAISLYESIRNQSFRRYLFSVILGSRPIGEVPAEAADTIREATRDWLAKSRIIPPQFLRMVDLLDIDNPTWGPFFGEKLAVRSQRYPGERLPASILERIVNTVKSDPLHQRGLLVLVAASLLSGSPHDSLNISVTPQPTDPLPTRAAIATIALLTGSRVSEVADQISPLRGDDLLIDQLFAAIELRELPQAEECAEYLELAAALDLSRLQLWPYLRENHLRRSSPLIDTIGWTQLGYPATIPSVLSQQAT